MATLIRPARWGQQKPPPGATLITGHPLAQGLVGAWLLNEGGGATLVNLRAPDVGTIRGPLWQPGPSLLFDGSNDDVLVPAAGRYDLDAVSIVAVGVQLIGSGTQSIVVMKDWDGVSNFALSCDLTGFGLDGMFFYDVGWQASGINTRINGDGRTHTVAGSYDGATLRYYLDGRLDASTSYAGTLPHNTTPLYFGAGAWAAWYYSGIIGAVYLYNRALRPATIQWLAVEPYALLAPAAPRLRYWQGAPASGVTGTGALTVRHPLLSGSGTTTVVGTGAVLLHHPTLAATGTTTVTGTAALTIRHPLLSATGTTTVTGTGALSIHHPILAASGAQGPTATGSLTIRHPLLAAAGTTTVTGTAALTIRHPVLAAAGTPTVTGTGSVTISHPTLLGAAPGTVTGSGALTVQHPLLTATGTTTVTVTGAVLLHHPVLAATGTTTVTGAGSLAIRHPLLSGAAPTTIAGTGALAIRHPVLAGLGTTTIVGHGALTIRHPVLAGTDQVVVGDQPGAVTAGASVRDSVGAGVSARDGVGAGLSD